MLTRAQVEAAANCVGCPDCRECAMFPVTDESGCVPAIANALLEMMDAQKQAAAPREGRIYRSDVDDVAEREA